MAEISIEVTPTGMTIQCPDEFMHLVRDFSWEKSASGTNAKIVFWGEYEEEPDRFAPAQGESWTVLDTIGEDSVVVQNFGSELEADAAIVGLEYALPGSVHEGRFTVSPPESQPLFQVPPGGLHYHLVNPITPE